MQTSTPLGSPSPSSRCLTTTPLALFLSLPFSVSRCLHFFLSRALSLSLAPCPGGARLPCMAAEHLCAPTRTSSASVSLPSHPAAASTPVPPPHTLSPSLSASLSLCLRLCLPPPLPLCVFWQGLRALLEADASLDARGGGPTQGTRTESDVGRESLPSSPGRRSSRFSRSPVTWIQDHNYNQL